MAFKMNLEFEIGIRSFSMEWEHTCVDTLVQDLLSKAHWIVGRIKISAGSTKL